MTDELLRLLGPGEPEVGCDECFDQLDRHVEAELAGERTVAEMDAHLGGCPACREEYESLRDLLSAEPVETGRMPG